MRHLTVIAFILIVVCHFEMVSQSCLPDGITFTTQSQIDSFPIYYPGCTEIEGDVIIHGDDISNFLALDVLTVIGGGFNAYLCLRLKNLAGLENLTSIGGSLSFSINDSLLNLQGLNNLVYISGILGIGNNDQLTDCSGLESL